MLNPQKRAQLVREAHANPAKRASIVPLLRKEASGAPRGSALGVIQDYLWDVAKAIGKAVPKKAGRGSIEAIGTEGVRIEQDGKWWVTLIFKGGTVKAKAAVGSKKYNNSFKGTDTDKAIVSDVSTWVGDQF